MTLKIDNATILNCYDYLLSSTLSTTDGHSSIAFGFKLCVLLFLTLLVISGNALVIMAVLYYKHLRGAAGLLIASLAAADLSVGLFVLPFSAINQASGIWPFGSVWCHIWLAIDVWMCTSSIYNLIAIAFDRFIAVTKPLIYRNLITRSRVLLIIMSVWLVSFLISLPPMIMTWPTAFNQELTNCTCSPMDNSPVYIVYSSIGSFHFPLVVIFYLYYRIYLTVRLTTNCLDKGYMMVGGQRIKQTRLKLLLKGSRRHSDATGHVYKRTSKKSLTKNQSNIMSPKRSPSARKKDSLRNSISQSHSNQVHDCGLRIHKGKYTPNKRFSTFISNGTDDFKSSQTNLTIPGPIHRMPRTSLQEGFRGHFPVYASPKGCLKETKGILDHEQAVAAIKLKEHAANRARYYRRLHSEIKAVKTVGLVTLCFVVCWLGFSIIYTLQAFCSSSLTKNVAGCVSNHVFTVFFWLGYVNSALNPLIYAAYNRKYRQAFAKILVCRIFRRNRDIFTLEYVASTAASKLVWIEGRATSDKTTPDNSLSTS